MGALDEATKDLLRHSYFLPYEIEELDRASDSKGNIIKLNTEADNFKSMIRDRVKKVEGLKAKGWSREKVIELITNFYKQPKVNVFTLLQVERSPSANQKRESDSSIAKRLAAYNKVKAGFGPGYASPVSIPRNIPMPPSMVQDWT
jgi:hypothetical protein